LEFSAYHNLASNDNIAGCDFNKSDLEICFSFVDDPVKFVSLHSNTLQHWILGCHLDDQPNFNDQDCFDLTLINSINHLDLLQTNNFPVFSTFSLLLQIHSISLIKKLKNIPISFLLFHPLFAKSNSSNSIISKYWTTLKISNSEKSTSISQFLLTLNNSILHELSDLLVDSNFSDFKIIIANDLMDKYRICLEHCADDQSYCRIQKIGFDRSQTIQFIKSNFFFIYNILKCLHLFFCSIKMNDKFNDYSSHIDLFCSILCSVNIILSMKNNYEKFNISYDFKVKDLLECSVSIVNMIINKSIKFSSHNESLICALNHVSINWYCYQFLVGSFEFDSSPIQDQKQ
jgi:hypothetical protein